MTTHPPTTADLLLARAADDRAALLFEDEVVTWSELVQRGTDRAALALAMREEGTPFHIAVLLENEPEYLYWIVAAALSGAAIVGVNDTRRGAELRRDISHTDCQILVTSAEHEALIAGFDIGLDGDRRLVVDAPDYTSRLAPFENSESEAIRQPVTIEDALLLLFTSGSTGAPKAVVCSQGRFARIATTTPSMFGVDENDIFYSAMPMFHGNALMASWALSLGTGGPWATRRKFSASNFIGDVKKHQATYFNYVGRSLAYILSTPEQPDDADNELRLGFGTEATERDMAEFARRFGCALSESYGSSEGAIVIAKTPDTPPRALGRPREGDVAIIDPLTAEECPRAEFGHDGELLNHEAIGEMVRRDGVNLFEGYYNNAEATTQRLRDGWYWSDDLAYRDQEGFIYFAGRGADWLRVDSENFSAAPIERIIARHPAVLVCAVFPVPDPQTGDQVMAAIEFVAGTTMASAELDEFIRSQADLGTKWSPRFVRVVDAMPLTGSNKIDKKPLRSERWSADTWWRPTRQDPLRPMTDADRRDLVDQFEQHGRSTELH